MFKILTPSKTSKGQIAGESQKGKYTPLRDSAENLGSPRENKASELRKENSKKTDKEESGSPIKQLGNNIKRGTQKIGNNFRTSIRKGKKKVEQKIPDDEEAVPQKGMIRPLEGNLPAAANSPNLSRRSTLENLSTIGQQREESKKQEEKPDSHGDSDSGVDLSGSNSEQNSESTINTSVSSGSAEHVEEIADSFNPLIEEYNSKVSKLSEAKSGALQTTQEPRTRSVSFSSSTESLNSILSAAEEDDTIQSDGEGKLNEKRSPILQVEQEPEVQEDLIQFEQIGPIRTEQEPINEITPIKKQSNDRNPNITLAICCLAACCFIAAADKESGMLFLAGITFLIAAIVIEWQTPPPSRELIYPSSSPFIDDKAVAKT
ncbi:MAG: hypothetical protein PG981_000580 [Wolbachia endosymbiont of Ctenocephalides orientis wCori]|nr:MAG: hypothetical protein PG981_000580 [Wolbachia endosymbiont of Ctenocephalides orientis wCori]